MTTVTELKALYVKLGGNAADVATIQTDAEMIEKIKEVAIPAELPSVTSEDNGDVLGVVEGAWAKMDAPSALPTVTSDDNGDVLTVVEGAWAKATPSAGGGGYVIYDGSISSNTFTFSNSKTVGDVINDFTNGKIVYLRDTMGKIYSLVGTSGDLPSIFESIRTNAGGSGLYSVTYTVITLGSQTGGTTAPVQTKDMNF